MKFKHNKKRNTALLYEYLVKELTRCVLKEDKATKKKIVTILTEFFQKNLKLKNSSFRYSIIKLNDLISINLCPSE